MAIVLHVQVTITCKYICTAHVQCTQYDINTHTHTHTHTEHLCTNSMDKMSAHSPKGTATINKKRRRHYYILVRHRVQGSTGFRTPRALGCSVPSAARALLRGRGVLNPWTRRLTGLEPEPPFSLDDSKTYIATRHSLHEKTLSCVQIWRFNNYYLPTLQGDMVTRYSTTH